MADRRKMFIEANDCYEDDKRVVAALSRANGLFERNKENGEIKYLGSIPGCTILDYDLCGRTSVCGDRVVFAPHLASKIPVYSLATGKINFLLVDTGIFSDSVKYGNQLFWNVVSYNDAFYLFGCQIPAVLKIEAASLKMEYITDPEIWSPDGTAESVTEWDFYMTDGCVLREGEVYLPMGDRPSLLRFSMEREEFGMVRIPCSCSCFWGLASDGDNFWMVGSNKEKDYVVRWNPFSGKAKEVNIPRRISWWHPLISKDSVYLFSYEGGRVLRIDYDTMEWKEDAGIERLLNEKGKASTKKVRLKETMISFLRLSDMAWCTYDIATGEGQCHIYEITDEDFLQKCENQTYRDYFQWAVENNANMDEGSLPLRKFCEFIQGL